MILSFGRAVGASALLTLLMVGRARAQPVDVTPPHAITMPDVPYPADAEGESAVILELVVEADGSVARATVIEGPAPFADAAMAAAPSWRFEPAHRGDVAVAARIRVRIAFTPPAPPEPEPAIEPEAPKAAPDRPSPIAVEDVNVTGTRVKPAAPSLGAGEVRQLPGAFGDAFRAVETLPGVVPIASGVPYFFVRGAPPGDTGYFLDGLRVPALFHVGVGPSVVHPALVEDIAFYPGAYPARYGRFTGGIVAGSLKEPAKERHGEVSVRAFDAGALLESPFADGRGTALVAGRYSYAGLLVPVFAPDTRMAYWDYQTRVRWDVGERGDAISVLALGSFDKLDQRETQNGPFIERIGYTFHRVDVRYDRPFAKEGNARVAATLGYDRTGQENLDVSKWLAATRFEVVHRLAPGVSVRAGGDVTFEAYAVEATGDRSAAGALFPARNELTGGVYVELPIHVGERLEVIPGLRGDVYTARTLGGADRPKAVVAALEPRLSVRYATSPTVTLLADAGVAHQRPSAFVTLPGLDLGGLADGLQQAYQVDGGVELKLPLALWARATSFYHVYRGLSDASSSCPDPQNLEKSARCAPWRVGGKAYGFELLVRRAITERVTGLASYTLSRSERVQPTLFGDAPPIPSDFDRTHVLNLALSVDLGRRWTAGARLVTYSGKPYSRLFEDEPIPPYNANRLDPFARLDLRLEKRWVLASGTRVAVVAEVLNALLSQESLGVRCNWNVDNGVPTEVAPSPENSCAQSRVGPLTLPSLGVEASF
jgi:TonB family protein